jgi:SAM-dependent methyltransferase
MTVTSVPSRPLTASSPDGAPSDAPDPARTEAFAGRLLQIYTDGIVALMLDVASRTGLLEALAAGAGTSQEIAARGELTERYVRECLGSLVTAGIARFDAASARYDLPPEHAACLTGEGSQNLAPLARVGTLLAHHVDGVARAFREGGGVPYEAFRPEFTEAMDGLSRGTFDAQLVDALVPLAEGLPARLDRGATVIDIGCGTGHSTNVLARAFPRSTFVGYDLSEEALDRGRDEAAAWGLGNVRFESLDLVELAPPRPADVVFAFDVIHDQADPVTVLDRVRASLADDGVFVMMDIKASSNLEDNVDNPLAPLLYGISTLHCMTVSLARDGAGLGTVWGEELACRMLADAGFTSVEVHDVPDDPLDSLYVARP